ncbi:uncharacterized protein C8A04DRAFT_9869 [Dichotomopilus funicola]|uniref:NACHT domain-containing protein n=1 Tax=Dichotomopilus funicola TaxID=1934379 RepID=A0AAN6V7T5_9PEZI|nr:hypothetical protein C8A04DRAFT_9869 [Dichotomopilus funicola]
MSGISQSLDATFQAATANFAASLTEKQRREFRGCSRKEVEDAIRDIETRLASQRRQRSMQRIAKFVEGMDQLGKVVEVFVNVNSTVAFVWGPIKFVLLVSLLGPRAWVETLDCLVDTYAEIGDFLPSLSQYENLLANHPDIGIYLQKYYCDVLEFHRKALAVFSRPSWKTVFHSAWRTFKTQFGPILTKLKQHRELLSDEKLTATIADVRQSVRSIEDKVGELSRHLQRLHIIDNEEAARRHREDLIGKRQFVLSKLDPPDYYCDLERASNQRWNSASGGWIEADTAFDLWVDTTMIQSRALYLTGIPGTGKTILASRVVQHLQQLQERGNPTGCPFLLLYFFFKHHQPDKRGFVPMLLSLLSQAVFQDEVLLDLVYQRCIRVDQQRIRSASLLRELAELVLEAQSICFVVVDALDECAGDQSVTAEDAQGQVIDWLESLMRHSQPRNHEASSGPSDRCIRLLISGQRNGLLERRLGHWPTVQVDSSLSHMNDIKTYCEAESLRIQQKFSAAEDARLGIVGKVTSTAKGMFLYAKVVLSNLLIQPTRGHFKRELREENFPKGMEQAYERVAVHILEGPDESQSDLARRILNLVLCAERPLFWKEIQARFCIDVQSETADLDFRLLEPAKKYCGALIEVGQKDLSGSPGSEPDDLVELVHETARMYLIQTGRFHLADLHADLAIFCAQYLSSAPFNPDMGKPAVTVYCRTGYYGFLDYAAANWWKHARQTECSKDTTILTTVAKLADALNPQDETATANTATDITAVRTQIHQIPGDGRDWEDAFPIEARVKLVRAGLEPLLAHANTESSADLEEISHLYGRVAYKCSKPWCYFFQTGFETASARGHHVRQHERPFRCGSDGCPSSQIGFATESELSRHTERVHSEAIPVQFPSGMRSNLNIFKAAREGKLDLIQELVTGGTSVNVQQKDGSTPLFLAARAGNYQVCRWLLEHGAKTDTRCTRETITALWAAVANDDLEIASLLIVDHGADISVHDSTGATMRVLMERSRCTRIPERFPLEFWLSGNPGKKGPGNMRPDVPNGQATTSSQALRDQQMKLMLLERQNKKRLQDLASGAGPQYRRQRPPFAGQINSQKPPAGL